MIEPNLMTAQQGLTAFMQGWGNGDFQPFLELLTDEFTFWYPYGKHRGKFSGYEGKAQMVAKCHDHSALGDRLKFNSPHHVSSGNANVMFEFECEGVISNKPYHGRIAISLDVSGDKISGFREYFGDIDW
jgi:ketosteroid isomerase-like protein